VGDSARYSRNWRFTRVEKIFKNGVGKKFNHIHTDIYSRVNVELKVDMVAIEPFGKETERGREHVLKWVGLGLTFNEVAIERCLQDWGIMACEFYYLSAPQS
jgi:hypothetical protein